jgi:hypothetical protein
LICGLHFLKILSFEGLNLLAKEEGAGGEVNDMAKAT